MGGGAAAGLVVRVVAEQADADIIRCLELQLGAEGLDVRGVLAFAGKTVIRIAVVVMVQAGDTKRGAFTDGDIYRALYPDGAFVAAADVHIAACFLLRLPAQELNHAAGGVPAEQRALGTFNHFHPFGIVKIADNGGQPR